MDDVARPRRSDDVTDLAAIVLGRTTAGDERHVERRVDAPERVPAWLDHTPARGYDARSVVVLAIVVATLAAIVGWATTIGREDAAPSSVATEQATVASSSGALGAAVSSATGVTTGDVMTPKAAPVAAPGPNLAAGRLTASRSGSGGGLVTVAIRNAGSEASIATELLVLADGDVMGRDAVPAIAAGASARVEVPLDWCPSGAVALVAIVDPGVLVREASEQDNAVTRSADFGC